MSQPGPVLTPNGRTSAATGSASVRRARPPRVVADVVPPDAASGWGPHPDAQAHRRAPAASPVAVMPPPVAGAVGMLAGFCGTLLTPMAANFNVVPANLLELPDRNAAFNGVIRAQAPTALILLVANILLMYGLAFRF